MKKFAWMIAALGLCAGSMVACGGDDEKKANEEACTEASECQSNYCNDEGKCADAPATDENGDKKDNDADCDKNEECKSGYCNDDKKCADDPALELPECEDNTDCENHAEGKLVCNVEAGVCVECLADNKEDAACDSSKPGPICVSNACVKCTDNAQCGDKHVCDTESGTCIGADLECTQDADCEAKDATKPFCVESACVAEKPAEAIDPCKEVTCDAGTCDKGICVTDDMKALEDGASCDPDEFQSFCLDNAAVQCGANRKVVRDKCADDNLGTCTAVDNWGKKSASCSGNEDMLKRCADAGDVVGTVDMCYGSQKWVAKIVCTTDVYGAPIALANGLTADCEATDCEYNDDGAAVCKAAE